MQRKDVLLALGAATVAFVAVEPTAIAQILGPGLGDPVTMVNNFARNALLGLGGVMVSAGIYKGMQVWFARRELGDAAMWLLGGGGLSFGTAAAIGFA